MKRMHNHGLTLIEIIVIIAIIAVLAGLILPVLGVGSRERARRISCASNLNQICKAMFMYADAPANNFFPTTSTNKDNPFACDAPLAAWGLLYNKYVADPRVFSCPSNNTPSKDLQAWVPGQSVPASCKYAYDPGHGPESVTAIAGDKKGLGQNSDNHGINKGQNVLIGAGTVEFTDSIAHKLEKGMIDKDIYSRNLELPRNLDGFLRR
jgi:type II secretory pathway pseudopilin PulG